VDARDAEVSSRERPRADDGPPGVLEVAAMGADRRRVGNISPLGSRAVANEELDGNLNASDSSPPTGEG
jgi:hypothetical protein